jgi:hypothetical protein
MPSGTKHDNALLKAHRLHAGIYRRVATKLGVDPSYVSRVAAGEREEPEIRRATSFARYNAIYAPSVPRPHSATLAIRGFLLDWAFSWS